MKILLTGASGLLGRAIYKNLIKEHEVLGCAFSRCHSGLIKLDLTDKDAVAEAVRSFKPDIIIHSAAERSPDICENDHEKTLRLNVIACEYLAEQAKAIGAPIIYISTDYVFDGSQAPYRVDALTNPLNFYGKSKLLGEEVFKNELEHYAILRVPVLYGRVEYLSESAIITLLQAVINPQNSTHDHWAIRYPTFVDDIADALAKFSPLLQKDKNLSATYHFSGDEKMTKYEICLQMAQLLGAESQHLHSNPHEPSGAARPKDCHLDDTNLAEIIDLHKTPFDEAFSLVLADLRANKIIS